MGRMDGSKRTYESTPVVKCISKPDVPLSLMTSVWWGSRHAKDYDPTMFHMGLVCENQDIHVGGDTSFLNDVVKAYPEYTQDNPRPITNVIKNLVKTMIDSDLPPLEAVNFVFEVDCATVAWRDQLVRCRDAGYWVQTSRTMDLSTMDVNRAKSIEMFGGQEAVDVYNNTVQEIRETYKYLQDLGIPGEDIRLAPGAQLHRVYWFVNFRVLLRLLKKRADWIAQGSLWTPILKGIFESLRGDIEYDYFVELLKDVACRPKVSISDGHVVAHHYDIENMDRYTGKDPQPCDPLWLAYHGYKMPEFTDGKFYQYLKEMYIHIWPAEYLNLLGWDPSDPTKKGPYDI